MDRIRLRTAIIVTAAVLFVPINSAAQSKQEARLTQEGRVTHPPVAEMSGIVKSPQFENVWWVHNDSGDEPRVFAIDSTGAVHLAPWRRENFAVGRRLDTTDRAPWPGLHLGTAAHVDYEDIAVEDSTLYLADIGNNGNARRDLGIYVIREPYYYARRTRPIRHLPVAYPDQEAIPAADWHFDAESLFVDDGTLYVLTKHREGQKIDALEPGTKLYRLNDAQAHEVNVLRLVDRHETIPVPTAAALSPGGNRLAMLCTTGVWLFPRPSDDTRWLSTEPTRLEFSPDRLKQAEGITWDDSQTLRITNEQRDVFVVPLTDEDD